MSKADVAAEVAKATGLSKKDAAAAVDAVINVITAALAKGNKVQLTGFGSFSVRKTKKRTARNIRTGETITVPARRVPVFRAGAKLKQSVAK
ncbi:MAG: HU family DNA-binding protein [Armatimonadetes bacterium]|nr:HU family DNA-binding protein [Armatimonadota bacterium]